ncbi:hypothetical protein [Geodermatophilus sp. URMC 65]
MRAAVVAARRALALHRLRDRQRDSLVRRTHHELLVRLLADRGAPDVLQRCELAAVSLTGGARRPGPARTRGSGRARPALRQLDPSVAAVVHAVHEMRVPALVCAIDEAVRALLRQPSAASTQVTEDIAGRVHRRVRVLIGAGRSVDRVGDVGRTLRESLHVLDPVRPGPRARPVHRLEDVHLRGLLTMLAEDERLRLPVAPTGRTSTASPLRSSSTTAPSTRRLTAPRGVRRGRWRAARAPRRPAG